MGKMFIHIHFLYRHLSLRIERFWIPKRYDLNTPGLAGISITSHNEATGIDRDIVVICSHGNLVSIYIYTYIYLYIYISYIIPSQDWIRLDDWMGFLKIVR